ncbi:hypothetical protein EV426DRAFT_431096 [Tirmania nivea]|nr:hypothetical protein EV426DRAFT_431096 [Tirmania nivea]
MGDSAGRSTIGLTEEFEESIEGNGMLLWLLFAYVKFAASYPVLFIIAQRISIFYYSCEKLFFFFFFFFGKSVLVLKLSLMTRQRIPSG